MGLIRSLLVKLSCDTVAFDAGTRRARTSLGQLAVSANTLNSMLRRAFAIGAGAMGGYFLVRTITKTLDAMDQTVKMAERLGMTANEFTKLQYAAQLSNVPIEQLTTLMERLNISFGQAQVKGGGIADLFKSLGVNLKAGGGTYENFIRVAEALQRIPDVTQRYLAARQLAGRGGGGLLQLGDIKRLADEAEKLGMGHSVLNWRRAKMVSDSLRKMKMSFKDLTEELVIRLTPAILVFSEAIGKIAQIISGSAEAKAKLPGMDWLEKWATGTRRTKTVGMGLMRGGARFPLTETYYEQSEIQKAVAQAIKNFKELDDCIPATEGNINLVADAFEDASESVDKFNAKVRENIETFGMQPMVAELSQLEKLKESILDPTLAAEFAGQIENAYAQLHKLLSMQDEVDRREAEATRWEKAKDRVQGWIEAVMTPFERMKARAQEIIEAMQEGLLTLPQAAQIWQSEMYQKVRVGEAMSINPDLVSVGGLAMAGQEIVVNRLDVGNQIADKQLTELHNMYGAILTIGGGLQ